MNSTDRYFGGRGRTVRITRGVTPTVTRHLDATLAPLGLHAGASILELGAGLGRFTEPLLARGFRVTAVDIAESLMEQLRADLGAHPALTTHVADATALSTFAGAPFDAVLGFFFLHHLPDCRGLLTELPTVLKPGGGVAFCEPNGLSPLIYAQITCTPGMSWAQESGVPDMRPGVVHRVLEARGFRDIRSQCYGMLPPRWANHPRGRWVERWIERGAWVRVWGAYRVFHARWPDAT